MRFTKIKFDRSKVKLEWDEPNPNKPEPDTFSLTSTDKPAPEFENALNDLRKHVEEICELPDGYCKDSEIRGVSFSYGGDQQIMGATISCMKTLKTANSPLTINTPYLPSDDYSGNNPNTLLLSVECIADLEKLINCAENYINGIRKQESLFKPIKKFQKEMQKIVDKGEVSKISISSTSFDNGREVVIAENKFTAN